MTGARSMLVVLVMAIPALFVGTWATDLVGSDEPREAALIQGTTASEWAVPRLNGVPFPEKPPLYYWAGRASFAAFGPTPAAARLPSAAFALVAALLTVAVGLRLGGPMVGLAAGLVLLTTAQFQANAHEAVTDLGLTATVALAILLYHRASRGPGGSRAWLLFYAAVGLSFYAKGLVGPVLVAATVLTDVALRRAGWRGLLAVRPFLGAAVFVAMVLPYAVALAGVPSEVAGEGVAGVIRDHWLRLATRARGHDQPWWVYASHLPAGFLPWTPALLAALWWRLRAGLGGDPLPLAWALGPFLVLQVSVAKRPCYPLPLYPALAIMVALWWEGAGGRTHDLIRRWTLALAVFAAMAAPLAFHAAFPDGVGLALAAAWSGVAATLLAGLWRSRQPRVVVVGAALTLTAAATFDLLWPARFPRPAPLRSLCDRIAARVDGGAALVGWRLDSERFRGGISFYLGRTFQVERDQAALLARKDADRLLLVAEPGIVEAGPTLAPMFVVVDRASQGHHEVMLYERR